MVLAGRRFYPVGARARRCLRSPLALLLCTVSILSIGFLIASLVPTARFAQPVGALIVLSDARAVGTVRAGRGVAAGSAGGRAACCR